MRVVYVGGAGRSGSTLLERMLGELPGVCALGEVSQLWHRAQRDDVWCGCGTVFAACTFWQAVGERAFGGWEQVDPQHIAALHRAVARTRLAPRLAAGRPGSGQRAQLTEYADYHARVYAAAAEVAGDAAVVVDSSKNPGLAYALGWAPEVELRVIHLVRDPRGVAYSWTKRMASGERGGSASMLRLSPARSALQWLGYNAAMSLLAAARRDRRAGRVPQLAVVQRTRYEDLLDDPAGTLLDLAAFAGVRLPAGSLDFIREGRASLPARHSVAGNPMRFTTGEVALQRDDAWRNGLPARHRWLVSSVCAPLIRAYGYRFAAAAAGWLPEPAVKSKP